VVRISQYRIARKKETVGKLCQISADSRVDGGRDGSMREYPCASFYVEPTIVRLVKVKEG
jgi:hypothetical protein